MIDIAPTRARFRLAALSAEALAATRSATLDILERVGVHFPSERALQVFAAHGAQVDEQTQVVRIPPQLVTEALSHAPRVYTLSGRVEGTDLVLDGAASYFATDGCGTQTVDFAGGQRRASCKEDVARSARLADYLSSVAFYWPMVSAQDYGRLAPLHELEASFNNTVKHVQTATVVESRLARYAVRMAEVVAGDRERMRARPPLSVLICTIAPLGQDRHGIEAAMVCAEAGVPVGFMSMPNMGGTAPATPAGALVVAGAEVVSAMVLMQLVAPGAPVFYSLVGSVLDPRSAGYMNAMPEKYFLHAASVQAAHDWGVPTLAGGFGVDAAEPASWQLGRDSVYSALLVALAGADMVVGLGLLQASTVLTLDQLVYDDEIYHMNRVVAEGIDTGAEGLALDVIAAVGPRGHFLAQQHTRKRVREIWLPTLTHPAPAEAEGDIRKRARAEAERILAEHVVEPLDDAAQAELQSILAAAAGELQEE